MNEHGLGVKSPVNLYVDESWSRKYEMVIPLFHNIHDSVMIQF